MKCNHCGATIDKRLMTADNVELSVKDYWTTYLKWNGVYRCKKCNELTSFKRAFILNLSEMAYQQELKLSKGENKND